MIQLDKSLAISNPKIEALADYYMFSQLDYIPQVISFGKKVQSRNIIGDVVGVKGPVLLISTPRNIGALNLKKIRGRSITHNPNASIVTQSGLNEFF